MRRPRTLGVPLLLCALLLALAAPSAGAVTRDAAAKKALAALGANDGDEPVIVFGLRRTIRPRALVTQAGPSGGVVAPPAGRNTYQRARGKRIRLAGAELRRAGIVMRAGAERSWFFFEDRGPHQAFEHAGRVVLVGAESGRVRVSGETSWVPLVDGRAPAFFRSARNYGAERFRVLDRPFRAPRAATRARTRQAAPGAPRQQVADALAAERSCALRVSDTLGDFFDFGGVDRTRARLGLFFEGLEELNAGFVSRRYTTSAGQTAVQAAQAMIDDAGCRDLFLYAAGAGTEGGTGGIVIGVRPARGGVIEWQVVTTDQLEGLVKANPGVTFKFLFDAPYTEPLNTRLVALPNVVLLLAAGAPDAGSFTFLPEVLGPDGIVKPSDNPDQLLEYTNAILNGLEAFVNDQAEVDRWLAGRALGGPSMMSWMMAQAAALTPAWMFSSPLDRLKLPVMPAPPAPPVPPVGTPPAINHAPSPTTPAQPTTEDQPKAFTLTATDADGDPLTFTITALPAHGTLTGTPPNLVYTPDKDFNGLDSFTYAVADGRGGSASATVQLPVGSDNDAATVTTTPLAAVAQFVEDGSPVTVDPDLTVTDGDSAQLAGATAAIVADRQSGDVLDAAVPAGVTKAYDAATGVLTLSGEASVAEYQQMLRSVTFDSASQAPGTSRSVEFRAEDGEDAGVPAERGLLVEAVNDAPVVTVPGAQTASEDTAKSLSPSVADVDAAGDDVKVDLGVDHGTLKLATVAGLTSVTGDQSDTVSLTGSLTEVNAALSGLTYQGHNNVNGADTLTVTADDLAHSGSGGTKTDSDTVAITVAAVNDAPAVGPDPDPTDVVEGVAKAVDSDVTVGDVDDTNIEGATVAISTGFESGDALILPATPGISGTYDAGTGVLELTGSRPTADYQAALRSVQFRTTNDTPAATRSIQFTVDDGTTDSETRTKALTVEAVNDAPAVTLPSAPSTSEDTSGALSPSVSDPDAAGDDVKVDLDVDHGTLTLSTIAGLTSSSGDGSGAVSLTGSLSEVNAAIAGLSYLPATNFSGADTLTAAIDDLGHSGSGGAETDGDSVTIAVSAVNDAPVNTVPGEQSAVEDTAKMLSGASAPSVADVDAGTDDVKVTLSALHGQMTLNGVTGDSVDFTGTVAQANAKLDGVQYTPDADYSGDDTVTLVTDDLTHNGSGGAKTDTDMIAFTVTGDNDAPSVTVPASVSTDEDTAKALSPSVSDPDAGGEDVKVDLTATHGTLTPSTTSGLTSHTGDGTGNLSLTGSVSEVNAALTGLSYAPAANYNGPDQIGVAISDLGHNGAGGAKADSGATGVTIAAVNDAPVNVLPAASTLDEDTSKTLGGTDKLSVSDVDAAGANALDVRLDVDHGTLVVASGSGATATGDGSDSVHLTGTFTQVRAALDGLTYTPAANYAGADTLTIVADDGGADGSGGAKSDTDRLPLTISGVNDAPTVAVAAPITTNEDTAKTLSPSVADVDADGADVKVDLSASHGSLTPSSSSGLTSSTGSGTGTVSLTGSVSEVNAALTGLTYTPNANRHGSDTIGVSVSDLGHTGSGGAKTGSGSVGVTVDAVNDAPVNTVPATATTDEDVAKALTFSAGDVDVDAGDLSVTLTATHGTVTLATTSGLSGVGGNGTSSATFTGTPDEVNAALTGFTYTPATNYNGDASVQMVTDDNGNTPAPAKTDTDATALSVAAVNDAPVNTVPAAQTLPEDGSKTLSSGAGTNPSVADVDADADDDLQVSLSVGSGTLTVDATNLELTAGDGTSDASMSFRGTKSEVNGALDGLTYTPYANFAGGDALQIVTSDLGHTGSGDAKTDTDSVGLTVSGVDDPPVNTVPASGSVTEDTPKPLTFSVADLDAGAQDVKATLTASHGKIDLAASPDATSLTGDDSKSVEIVGSVGEVNTALTSFVYTPDADYAGADDALQIVTSDLGHTGTGGPLTDTDSTTLTFSSVNDAPVVSAPGSATTPEDTRLVFSPVPTVNDVDAGGDDLRVTVSVSQGTLTLATDAGITKFDQGDGSDDSAMTFEASESVVNNTLNGLKYDPDDDFNGGDALDITVSDEGGNGDDNVSRSGSSTTDLVVGAVNDAPVVDLNGSGAGTATNPTFAESLTRDNTVTLAPSTTITDVDDADIESATVKLTNRPDGSGESLTATGTSDITVDPYDSSTGVLHLRGTAPKSEYAQVLRTVAYANTQQAPDATDRSITFVVNDGHDDSASATSTVKVVPLNTPPIVDLDTTQPSFDSSATFTEDAGPVNIAPNPDITDADLPDTHMESATVTLTNRPDGANESLSTNDAGTSGITVGAYDPSTGVLPLHGHGTVADYETLLSGVKYDNASETPSTADRSITVVVSDGQASSTTRTATVEVDSTNDAITNAVPGAQTGTEDIGITFSGTNGNAISIRDADAGSGAVKVKVSAGHGSLSAPVPSGGSRSGDVSRALELTGTVSAVNGALDGLSYTPDANRNGDDTITVAADDQGNSGGPATTDSDTIAVSLAAVNDAPQNTVPGARTVNEDANLVFSTDNGNAITTDDADSGASPIRVTLGAANGVLTLGGTAGLTFTTGDGANDPSLVFTGTLADVKSALTTVTYRGNANFFGSDTLTLKTNDQGHSGGAAIEDTSTVAITVDAVNDEPTFTKGADQANVANQDAGGNETTRTVNGWATSISKGAPNESGQAVTFTVTTSNDALFSTLPAIDAATGNLTYTPSKTTSGTATVSVVLTDDGGTANGGDDTFTTQTFTITTVFPPPVARNDPAAGNAADYAATGGVPIDIPSSIGVLANDDLFGATIASYGASTGNEQATIATSTATAGGGFVTLNASGSFRYEPPATPPAGGNDTFTYRVSNPGGASTATVTIAVTNQIVFVDSSAAGGGNGTQLRPYDELDDVPTTRSTGGVLFVASGTYTDDDGTEAVLLKSGEHLVGQGVALASNLPFVLKPRSIGGQPAAGTAPAIGTSATTADGVALNTNNTLKGVTLGTSTRHALRGSAFDTLTVGNATTINTTGQAISLATGTLSGGFSSVSSSGGTSNIDLSGVQSSGTFTFGGGALSGASGDSVRIVGQNGSFSYTGSITNTTGTRTVAVEDKTGGNLTFSGNLNPAGAGRGVLIRNVAWPANVTFSGTQKKLAASTGAAIQITGTTGSTTFTSGGLDVDTTGGAEGLSSIASGTVSGGSIDFNGVGNTITAVGGRAINIDGGPNNVTTLLAIGATELDSVSSSGSSTNGIRLDDTAGFFSVQNVGTSGGTLQTADGAAIEVNGGASQVTYNGEITNGQGNTATISNRVGGSSVSLGGPITESGDADATAENGGLVLSGNSGGSAVSLTNASKTFNTGEDHAIVMGTSDNSALTLSGGNLDVDTTTGNGLDVTDSGTLAVTGSANTIETGSGRALNVSNTDIGAGGLTLQKVASNGATNGIRLSNTGSTAGLTITGSSTAAETTTDADAAASGGTIQNTTGHAIDLTATRDVVIDNLNITGADRAGVKGTGVTNFSYTDGVLTNVGDARVTEHDAAFAFNPVSSNPGDIKADRIGGAFVVKRNNVQSPYGGGVQVRESDSTPPLSDVQVTHNQFVSATADADSQGDAISFYMEADGSDVGRLPQANLSNNTIRNFPGGQGIELVASSIDSVSGPRSALGVPGSATNKVVVDSNLISGQASNPIAGFGVAASVSGRSEGNVEITNNGTPADPVANMTGEGIAAGASGDSVATFVMSNNVIRPNNSLGNVGMSVNGDARGFTNGGTLMSPNITATLANNTISQTSGSGIHVKNFDSNSTLRAKVTGNTVSAPVQGNPGIRLENGATNRADRTPTLCVQAENNNATGSSSGALTYGGFHVLNRGESSSGPWFPFQIVGLGQNDATAQTAVDFLESKNPGSSSYVPGSSFFTVVSNPLKKVTSQNTTTTFDTCSSF